jgi:fatty acid amide hydrolase
MTSAARLGESLGNALANPGYYLPLASGVIIGLYGFVWIIKKVRKSFKEEEWKKQATVVRRDRDAKIENFLREHKGIKLSEERKRYIINLPAVKLVEHIRAKKISAVEALITYIQRAATVGRELGLIADVNFEAAYRQAEEIDLRIYQGRITNEQLLLGLPISIKDQIAVKGALQTIGITSLTSYLVGHDSDIVAVLKSKGAIPFVLSNSAQGLSAYDTNNCLWGTAINPWNRKKTPGGSSGGEAGLVASRCSPCGIGSDITGSIRLPAAFCGAYGFKPTQRRVSLMGVYNVVPGLSDIQFSLGPICRSMDDIVLLMRSLFGNFTDTYVYNLPFNELAYNNTSRIKIAYMVDNSYFETAPIIKTVITDIVEKMAKKGYDMIPIRFDLMKELTEIGYTLLYNSGWVENINNLLKGEAMDKYSYQLTTLRYSSRWCNTLLAWFRGFTGESRLNSLSTYFKDLKRTEQLDLVARFNQLKGDYIRYLRANRLEAIICPVFPTTAPNLTNTTNLLYFGQFLTAFNYLDMPAGTVPITLNTSLDYTSKTNDSLTRYLAETMKDSINLPIGIQVAALPNQDELCLRVMKEIDGFYSFDINTSSTVVDQIDVSMILNDRVDEKTRAKVA